MNHPTNHRAILLVLVTVTAGALAACRPSETHVHLDGAGKPADDRPKPGQFVVTGTATLDVHADTAEVHLTLSSESPSPKTAATTVRARQAKLIAALETAGVTAKDLTFSSLGINAVYDDVPLGGGAFRQRLRGYAASISITADTRDFDKLPDLMEVAAAAGATDVSTSQKVTNLSALKAEVRGMALDAAKGKALQTAGSLGFKLGRIVAVVEDPGSPGTGYGYLGNQVANSYEIRAAPQPGMAAATDSLTLSIQVTYELA